jgi:hypothetical protein
MEGSEAEPEKPFHPEEAERRITDCIPAAEELPGPSVDEVVDAVAAVLRDTWSDGGRGGGAPPTRSSGTCMPRPHC